MQENLTLKIITDEILLCSKMNLTELARELGISQGHLTNIRTGRTKLPRRKKFWNNLIDLHSDEVRVNRLYETIFREVFCKGETDA